MLPQVDIDVIRQWITDGAVDDTASSTKPIAVASILPAPGATLTMTPARIVVSFDREPDASTVHAGTFVLEASGGDMTFGDGNERLIAATSVGVPSAAPRSAVFDLAGRQLAADVYRVTLTGTGPSFVMDNDANALEGNADALPGGQNYEAWFSVGLDR